jgi:dTDP-4-dehydrorhamnose reductase
MKSGIDKVEVWGGIECTINRVKDQYFDQLEQAGHYNRHQDIERFAGLGIKTLRYPILWEKHQPHPTIPINWEITEKKLHQFNTFNIEVIAGLVHHGSGPPYVNMLDDSFPQGLATYAAAVAEKFPWINYYTPVNEPLTTARFCGLYGIWHPHGKTTKTFCKILINECKATVLAMQAIRKINPAAKLVQTDDLGKTHSTRLLKYQADFENERRWLSWDLLCGKVNDNHLLWDYLLASGIKIDELEFFIENKCPPDIIGINHYLTSERYLDQNVKAYPKHTRGGNGKHRYADIEAVRVGHICPDGPYKLIKEAWDRYQLPIVITETHLHCTREEQMRWLYMVWQSAVSLKEDGVNIKAVTVWALLGSFGWSKLLTHHRGEYEAGVFDLSGGEPRATALAGMINALNTKGMFDHPVLANAGWWQRQGRATYGNETFYNDISLQVDCRPVLIVAPMEGLTTDTLARICDQRGIRYVKTIQANNISYTDLEKCIKTLSPWAIINAGFAMGNDPADEDTLEFLADIAKYYGIKLLGFIPDQYNLLAKNVVLNHNSQALIIINGESGLLPDLVDASIDLLLDDESGIWDAQGVIQVSQPLQPQNHYQQKTIIQPLNNLPVSNKTEDMILDKYPTMNLI